MNDSQPENGQARSASTATTRTGEGYTMAHHLLSADGHCMTMVASLRYVDTLAKE